MPRQNIEIVRQGLEAFNARDIDGMIELYDPGAELHSAFAAVGATVYRGHEGLRNWHRDLEETWGHEIRLEPEKYFERGQQVLVYCMVRARGRQSGVAVTMPVAQLATVRNGLYVYFKVYQDREQALRDLGVTEDALEEFGR